MFSFTFFPFLKKILSNWTIFEHSDLFGSSVILLKCSQTVVYLLQRYLLDWGGFLLCVVLDVLDKELSGGNL